MRWLLPIVLALLAVSGEAAMAGEIRVLSAGVVEPGLAGLAEVFRRDTGHQVRIAFATAPALRRKVGAGEPADVLIAPPGLVDELVKAGKVLADDRATVGRVGVGIAVRDGARVPDISTPEALKQAVLAADSLVYNEASTGIYFARLLERLGIAEGVKARSTRYPDGVSVFEHVIKGKGNEIGVGAMTEIVAYGTKGLKLVGPLPAEVQNYTTYDVGVMATASSPDAARAFARFLITPQAKATFAATGVQ